MAATRNQYFVPLVRPDNVALLFVATAVAYFLTYEWLHLCHHARPEGRLGSIGFLRRLRAHHRAHHDPALMSRGNFNITFPVCDAIFGTKLGPVDRTDDR